MSTKAQAEKTLKKFDENCSVEYILDGDNTKAILHSPVKPWINPVNNESVTINFETGTTKSVFWLKVITNILCLTGTEAPEKATTSKAIVKTEPKELSVVRKLTIDNFNKAGAIKETVDAVKEHYKDLVFDTSTKEGRESCAAVLKEIKTNSNVIFDTRKSIAAELKLLPKIVDAEGKYAKDELDAFIAEIGKPLAKWKEEEKAKKLQKQVDAEHEIALIMNEKFDRDLERDQLFIEKGEAFMQAEAEHEAAEKAKEDAIALNETNRLALENARLLQEQAVNEAALEKEKADQAIAANAKIQEQANEQQLAWQAGEEERKAKAAHDAKKLLIDSNYSQLVIYHQNIQLCQSIDILNNNVGIFNNLRKFDFGYQQHQANELINKIVEIDTNLRAHFLAESLKVKVHIEFPNEAVSISVMNTIIDSIVANGFLWEKQGHDTLIVKEKEIVPQTKTNEWSLR